MPPRGRGSHRFLGPGDDDRVLLGRVTGDDVVGGLRVREVLDDVGDARRHVEHVAGLQLQRLLEAVAPHDADPAAQHVERALARVVVVRARARAGGHAVAAHVDVRGADRRLRDLGAADDPAGRLAVGSWLDDSHPAGILLLSGSSICSGGCSPASWSTCSVVCSIPNRSRSSAWSARRRSWQSSPACTTTWADSAGNPEVTSHTWRSWTSTTPAWPASARPISSGSMPAGAASMNTRPDSLSRP